VRWTPVHLSATWLAGGRRRVEVERPNGDDAGATTAGNSPGRRQVLHRVIGCRKLDGVSVRTEPRAGSALFVSPEDEEELNHGVLPCVRAGATQPLYHKRGLSVKIDLEGGWTGPPVERFGLRRHSPSHRGAVMGRSPLIPGRAGAGELDLPNPFS
jgi:hypothetical protein